MRLSGRCPTAPALNQLGGGCGRRSPVSPSPGGLRLRTGQGLSPCSPAGGPHLPPLSGWPESPSHALGGCPRREAVVGAGPPDLPRCLSGLADRPFPSHPGWRQNRKESTKLNRRSPLSAAWSLPTRSEGGTSLMGG